MHKIRSVGDAHQRFQGTVLNDNGRAFYVMKASSATELRGRYLDSEDLVTRPITCEIVQPYHVGYVFYRKYAIYTERLPARRVLQGLHPNNLRVSKSNPDTILYSSEFGTALRGEYPSVEAAIKLLKGDSAFSVPVSREFAIAGKRLVILYQERNVGSFVDGKPMLDEGRSFLRELFSEVFDA